MVSVLEMLEQLRNAEEPMLLTLSGILMVPNDVLFWNAEFPMTRTFPPIVAFVILPQPEKALSPMLSTVFPIVIRPIPSWFAKKLEGIDLTVYVRAKFGIK